jgi:hypothetical protein
MRFLDQSNDSPKHANDVWLENVSIKLQSDRGVHKSMHDSVANGKTCLGALR